MTDIHTPDEHIAVADLEAMVDVTLALLDRGAQCRLAPARSRLRDRRAARRSSCGCEVDGVACVAYPRLTGPVADDDEVLVNVQARELGLGSGGFDVLYANLTRGLGLPAEQGRT